MLDLEKEEELEIKLPASAVLQRRQLSIYFLS